MFRQSNTSVTAVRRVALPLLLFVSMSFAFLDRSEAAQPGHGRVNSEAGAPLQVTVPVHGLTSEDLKGLSASIAAPQSWADAGLTLPAPIETLSVVVEPGRDASSRQLIVRSSQAVNRPVIDVLIRLSTASGIRMIQSSYLVLTKDPSAGANNSVRVARGDTLYEIALSKAVSGADIYQVMWAIYEANPQAFISENMNLLRAGTTLSIPDAATMRAVDAKHARAMFAKHDQAFRARRGAGQVSASVPVVASSTNQSGSVTAPTPAPGPASTGDQVRLDSTNPADQQADKRVATENELREMRARVEALQKNVEDLKDALNKSQASASVSAGQSGFSGSSAVGVPGAPGAAGAPGAEGVPGAKGAAGTPGAAGVPGLTGSAASSGVPGATGATGTTGAAGTPGTDAKAANEVKSSFTKLKEYASDHVLGFVLGISALLALLIAFLLRRAGRQEHTDAQESPIQNDPKLASAFDQKLQSIDLNLSDDVDAANKSSVPPKTGA